MVRDGKGMQDQLLSHIKPGLQDSTSSETEYSCLQDAAAVDSLQLLIIIHIVECRAAAKRLGVRSEAQLGCHLCTML